MLDIKHLSNLEGDARLLVCSCKVLKLLNNRGDTDKQLCTVLLARGTKDACGKLLKVLGGGTVCKLLDNNDILLGNVDDIILVLIGHDGLDNLIGGKVGCTLELYNDDGAVLVIIEMKLVGFDVNVVGENVVKDDVLDERALVILLVIEALDTAERYCKHLCGFICLFVCTLYEYDAVILAAGGEESVGVAVEDDALLRVCKLLSYTLLGLSDSTKLGAGNNDAVLVDNTNGVADNLLHLVNNGLE